MFHCLNHRHNDTVARAEDEQKWKVIKVNGNYYNHEEEFAASGEREI